MTDDKLMKPSTAVAQKLRGTLTGSSLNDLVNRRKRERKSYLLLDHSSSMSMPVQTGSMTQRITALREIIKELHASEVFMPMIAFADRAMLVQDVPNPYGGTALHSGIEYAKQIGAEHLIVISDGEPDDAKAALQAGVAFDGPIDVFYVGPKGGPGEQFLEQLCNTTGGTYEPADLKETKQLQGKIMGLIGAGTPQLGAKK